MKCRRKLRKGCRKDAVEKKRRRKEYGKNAVGKTSRRNACRKDVVEKKRRINEIIKVAVELRDRSKDVERMQ